MHPESEPYLTVGLVSGGPAVFFVDTGPPFVINFGPLKVSSRTLDSSLPTNILAQNRAFVRPFLRGAQIYLTRLFVLTIFVWS